MTCYCLPFVYIIPTIGTFLICFRQTAYLYLVKINYINVPAFRHILLSIILLHSNSIITSDMAIWVHCC